MEDKKIDFDNLYVNDFYKMKILDEEIVESCKKDGMLNKLNFLFLIRIFWKIMNDLDVEKKGYKVEDWKFEDYTNLLFRLDEIDLNKEEYRLYFQDMVKILGEIIREKMSDENIDENLNKLVKNKKEIEDDEK